MILLTITLDHAKTIIERLVRLETLLETHIIHHQTIENYLLFPIAVGVALILAKEIIMVIKNHK